MSHNDFYCDVRVKPYIVLYRKNVKNCFPFFCRGVDISRRHSNLTRGWLGMLKVKMKVLESENESGVFSIYTFET